MKNIEELSHEEQAIILARRAYKKAWRAKNKDRVKLHNERFYKKLAEKMKEDSTI